MAYFKNLDMMLNPHGDKWGGMREIRKKLKNAPYGQTENIIKMWRDDKVIGTTMALRTYGLSKKVLLANEVELDFCCTERGHYMFSVESIKKLAAKRKEEKEIKRKAKATLELRRDLQQARKTFE